MNGEMERPIAESNRKCRSLDGDIVEPGGPVREIEPSRSMGIATASLVLFALFLSIFGQPFLSVMISILRLIPKRYVLEWDRMLTDYSWIGYLVVVIPVSSLLAAAIHCVYTDMKCGKIRNVVTYPTAILIIASNIVVSLLAVYGEPESDLSRVTSPFIGSGGITECLTGGLLCFAIMFFSFLTAGGGGGDVKLGTLIGLALGPKTGAFALMYSYLFAGAYLCLVFMVWQASDRFRSMSGTGLTTGSSGGASAVVRLNGSSGWFGRRGIWLRMSPFFLIGTLVAIAEAVYGGGL